VSLFVNEMSDEQLADRVAEAASDYKLGTLMPEFAELNGGIEKLREYLFQCVTDWENHGLANAPEIA
jgi:hypothetical protein